MKIMSKLRFILWLTLGMVVHAIFINEPIRINKNKDKVILVDVEMVIDKDHPF